MNPEQVEKEVESVMEMIDESPCAQSDVPVSVTRDYYEDIIDRIKIRLDAL